MILVGEPDGKSPLRDVYVDGRIILKWFSQKWDGVVWTGLIWLKVGTSGGLF
jgi:hypothetical protein